LKQFPKTSVRRALLALEQVKEQLECAVNENLQWKRKAKGLKRPWRYKILSWMIISYMEHRGGHGSGG
jgi:hypothetical protein